MISDALKKNFESIIEVKNIHWTTIEKVVKRDTNILRPIKGVMFESFFKKTLISKFKKINIKDGEGDSDVDVIVNDNRLQLKTIDSGSTKINSIVGVALHKTHGDETRPNNLYKKDKKTFDYLVVLHPLSGIMIVPYNQIPEHSKWNGYLDDPIKFGWKNEWINRWDLLGYEDYKSKSIESRLAPIKSELPFLSSETYLEDYEIIETLSKPEYFRAAVMGLKGNIKELWFEDFLIDKKYEIQSPTGAYPKYDLKLKNKKNVFKRIQTKGTSKNMCELQNRSIGLEIMGTHGQFPNRGYKKSYFDYVVCVISQDQIPADLKVSEGLHFVFLPVKDLPLHYFINQGIKGKFKGTQNEKWNLIEFNDVIYPNIKLAFSQKKKDGHAQLVPNITAYRDSTLKNGAEFSKAGPFLLDYIPEEF